MSLAIAKAPAVAKPDDLKSFFPDDSEKLTLWSDRFDRPVKVFKPGEEVVCFAKFYVDNGDVALVVAKASCAADKFVIHGASAEDAERIEQYSGAMVVARVTIEQKLPEPYSCHGSYYRVSSDVVLKTLPLNPTTAEIAELPVGTHVILQGIFLEYEPYGVPTTYGYVEKFARLHLDVGNRTLTVRLKGDEFKYSGGDLERVRGKKPIKGEVMRLIAFTVADGTLDAAYEKPYMLVAHPRRIADFDALRELVRESLAKLEQLAKVGKYRAAREVFADVRTLDLTHSEEELTIEAARAMPEDERPVFQGKRHSGGSLKKSFGVDVETLNHGEFLLFAAEVLEGRHKVLKKSDSATEVYDYMSPDEEFSFARNAIRARLPRLEACEDVHEISWPEEWIVEQSINVMVRSGVPEAYDELKMLIEYCLERGYFRHVDPSQDNLPSKFSLLLVRTLRLTKDFFHKNPQLGVDNQPDIRAWLTRLEDVAEYGVLSYLWELVPFR